MDAKPTRKPASKWHGVTVVLETSSCAAAALCRNTRYLSREAPRLPLSTCPHPESCKCRYKHFEDRRSGVRRGSDIGKGSDKPKSDRRTTRGRRARDQER
jgi:hypothetical protein